MTTPKATLTENESSTTVQPPQLVLHEPLEQVLRSRLNLPAALPQDWLKIGSTSEPEHHAVF
ncbi:hypothetical protein [Arthrobacter sp. fls2-241-R2A-200]|uniref:hypothetical protein n=1 Tax=unclassified Arthrobacter TaxID=235627 RepID=UPI00254D04C7|nr:hypothetical protein [Arthrobacter sp. fls2-241-R2A-200]